MAVVAFDTLKLADKLQAGGFSAEQARTAAGAFAEAMSASDLATRADVTEIKAEITATKSDLRRDIAESKSEILRWMFGAMAAQTALIVGLIRLVH